MTDTTDSENNISSSLLCATGKMLARVIDGASERAVLVADDGTILHRNEAARNFLYTTNTTNNNTHHVTDFLVLEEESSEETTTDTAWRSLTESRLVMKSGTPTRNKRNLHWVLAPEPCACCGCHYHTVFVCSKHERIREVVDAAFDPVITTDETGTIRTANKAACDLFGYSEPELKTHNICMLCADGGGFGGGGFGGGGGGTSKDNDGTYSTMQEYMDNMGMVVGTRREVVGRRVDGTEFPCELGVQLITDVSTGRQFFCGFFKDLTLLKQHEAELQERQALTQGMINASFDSMLEIDDIGTIVIVNDAACSMFGYSRQEFIGNNISMICGDDHAAKHDMYLKHYKETGVRNIIGRKRQVKGRRKDGSEVEVELGVQEVTLGASTGKKVFCGFIRDLTAQQKDKRALRKQQQLIHGKFFGNGDEEQG